jgi:putative transposase
MGRSCSTVAPVHPERTTPRHPTFRLFLNPVRAAMVAMAGDYRWSSHRCNAHGAHDPLVTPHAEYLALGADPQCRRQAYRAMVDATAATDDLAEIHVYLHQQRALGSARFQAQIEAMLGRQVVIQPRGRPRKHVE